MPWRQYRNRRLDSESETFRQAFGKWIWMRPSSFRTQTISRKGRDINKPITIQKMEKIKPDEVIPMEESDFKDV
jgi:hypothetical protein